MAKILVLEDDDNLRLEVQETLEDDGHQVTPCPDPNSAVKAAKKASFDLMLTDVRMAGGVDGVGALQQVQAIRPNIRSIIMTGYADLEVPPRAANLQANDYLLKGDKDFGLKTLLASVQRVLTEPEPQRTSWMEKLVSYLKSPKKDPDAEKRLALEQSVQQAKDSCWNSFFVLLRSGHLSLESGADYWARLESQERLESSSAKADFYLNLFLKAPTAPTAGVQPQSQELSIFLKRVRRGEIDRADFCQALDLRLNPESRRASFENFCSFQRCWGTATLVDAELSKLTGQQVDGYQIGVCRAVANGVALYEAKSPESKGLVELLFCQDDGGPAVPGTQLWKGLRYQIEIGRSKQLSRILWASSPNELWKVFEPFLQALKSRSETLLVEDDVFYHPEVGLGWSGPSTSVLRAVNSLQSGHGMFLNTTTLVVLPLYKEAMKAPEGALATMVLLPVVRQLVCEPYNRFGLSLLRKMGGYDHLDYQGCWSRWCHPTFKGLNPDTAFKNVDHLLNAWKSCLQDDTRMPLTDAYPGQPLQGQQAADWWLPLAHWVEKQHQQGEFFGRLSPRNVTFSRDGIQVSQEHLDGFSAPEVRAGQPATQAADVFSLAALLACMLVGPAERLELLQGNLASLPERTVKCLQPALASDPEQRPATVEALIFSTRDAL